MTTPPSLQLAFGFRFEDLYDAPALQRLDQTFLEWLARSDPALAFRVAEARLDPAALEAKQEATLLLELAPHLEDFLARLFGIESEVRALEERHDALAPLFSVKRLFVQRKAMNRIKADVAAAIDGPVLEQELEAAMKAGFSELAFARHVTRWQQDETANSAILDVALRYAAWSAHTPAGQARPATAAG
jgi:hypothetical protein